MKQLKQFIGLIVDRTIWQGDNSVMMLEGPLLPGMYFDTVTVIRELLTGKPAYDDETQKHLRKDDAEAVFDEIQVIS